MFDAKAILNEKFLYIHPNIYYDIKLSCAYANQILANMMRNLD